MNEIVYGIRWNIIFMLGNKFRLQIKILHHCLSTLYCLMELKLHKNLLNKIEYIVLGWWLFCVQGIWKILHNSFMWHTKIDVEVEFSLCFFFVFSCSDCRLFDHKMMASHDCAKPFLPKFLWTSGLLYPSRD